MLGFRVIQKNSRFFKVSSPSFLKRSFQNMSKPILYGDEVSPPVRAVMITASLLGIDLDFHRIDLFKGENRSEFYKKINPLHKVPSLLIDGEVICDSHAIVLYLCQKVEHQDLYPKDNLSRAKVNQMIFFNATTLFPIDSAVFTEYFSGKWPADESKVNQWYTALDHLEQQLHKHKWLSGNKMQLSDICCSMTLSSLGVIIPPLERHKKVKEWLKELDSFPHFEINQRGLERLRACLAQFTPSLIS